MRLREARFEVLRWNEAIVAYRRGFGVGDWLSIGIRLRGSRDGSRFRGRIFSGIVLHASIDGDGLCALVRIG
jgi:hypothetical protein